MSAEPGGHTSCSHVVKLLTVSEHFIMLIICHLLLVRYLSQTIGQENHCSKEQAEEISLCKFDDYTATRRPFQTFSSRTASVRVNEI